MTSEGTTMTEHTIQKLRAIGLRVSDAAVDALLRHAIQAKLSPTQVVELLAEVETRERESRNLLRRTKAATLGKFKPLDQFDWNHPRDIDRDLYEHKHDTLDFLIRGENILFRGQVGVGKTTLAKHFALRALAEGYSVRFCTLAAALADLMRQESIPALERRLKRYTTPDLLILDELGYLACEARAADILFHIISRRHEARSVVITTNLAYKHWSLVFPDAPCLSALIDRFAHHCHVFDIDADSWRDKERKDQHAKAGANPKRKSAHNNTAPSPTRPRSS